MTINLLCGALVVVAVIAIVFNPTVTGVGFALFVLIGACLLWLFRALYESEDDA